MALVRVLFSTTAGAGHFGPQVPVARACLAAGHQVVVAAPASFGAAISKAGFHHQPFDEPPPPQIGALVASVADLSQAAADKIVVQQMFGRLTAGAALPGLARIIEGWRPDVIVREPYEVAGLIAAERAGLPQAQVAIGLHSFTELIADWMVDPVRALAAASGLDPDCCTDALRSTPTLSAAPIALESPSRDGTGPIGRYRAEPPPTRPLLPPPWGDPDRPLVYVSFGSVTARVPKFAPVYAAALRALGDLDVRVLLTTGAFDPEALRPWPANAYVTGWWPQERVMPEACVVVGHGGFGTTMTALANGVPQLIMPLFASDQHLNAARLAELGAGLALPDPIARAAEIPALVEQLLSDPSFAGTARTLGAEITALPDVETAVALLTGLATPPTQLRSSA